MSPFFYRDFALVYLPKVLSAVEKSIASSSEANIRTFTKEKLEMLFNSLGLLCKRTFSLGEKYLFVETLSLKIALMCLKTDFLEKRIQGLKMVSMIDSFYHIF